MEPHFVSSKASFSVRADKFVFPCSTKGAADHSGRAMKRMNCLCPLRHWGRCSNPTRGMDVCPRLCCSVYIF
jgi:hypothetical protein